MNEHYAVTVQNLAGALMPVQVTPYCNRCKVGWPCPPAAAELGDLVVLPSTTVPVSTSTTVDTRCVVCGAAWPCTTASRRGGVPTRHGGDGHVPVTLDMLTHEVR